MSSDIPRSARTATDDDPYRLGWRHRVEIGPDGQRRTITLPLTDRDLLFPEEGDQAVQTPAHIRDWVYLLTTFGHAVKDRPATRVFIDQRVDFNLPDTPPLGPDLIVLADMPEVDDRRGTIDLKDGPRPLLVLEITSESTREKDFNEKFAFYQQARVPLYVIVDHLAGENRDEVWLRGFEYRGSGYVKLAAEAERLWLAPLALWLGIHEGQVFAYTTEGERIAEPARLLEMMAEQEQRLRTLEDNLQEEVELRHAAQRAARAAEEESRLDREARVQAERQARLDNEARVQAEAAQAAAERKARADATARQQAEMQARADAAARLEAERQRAAAEAAHRDMAAQLAAMQQELARLRGQP